MYLLKLLLFLCPTCTENLGFASICVLVLIAERIFYPSWKNYFQALKIYFHALKIYYQALKINFHAMKIILSAEKECFVIVKKRFFWFGKGSYKLLCVEPCSLPKNGGIDLLSVPYLLTVYVCAFNMPTEGSSF